MYLKPFERLSRSFSLRLNLWYAAFFTIASLVLFLVAYLAMASSVQQKEKELIRAKLEDYRAWYEGGGLDGLSQKFFNTPGSGRNAFFVRLTGPGGKALFVNSPDNEQGINLDQFERNNNSGYQPWMLLPEKNSHTRWMVGSTLLSDGSLLQVGKSMESPDEILARFRIVFGFVLIGVVILGFFGGALLTFRAFQPIRQLTQTARVIIETGQMNSRVPTRQTGGELDELVTLFNRMLEKNEALIRGMREALDNVAHDLRTPMARLRGTAEIALQSAENPDACREALADSMEESERVLTMLKTLMDISEAETGTMRLNIEKIHLPSLIQDVLELYQIVAEEKKIALRMTTTGPVYLLADRVRLQQALANLLDNAIKYTPTGGQVEVTASQNPSQVVIQVKDSGMGIAQAELPRIWERLYRGDKSRSLKGLGLGLCLVKAVVQAHHGTVEVVSQPDLGSVFTITLPSGVASPL